MSKHIHITKSISIKAIYFIMLSMLISFACCTSSNFLNKTTPSKSWIIAKLLNEKPDNMEVLGNPELIDSPYGIAVYFNGENDGIIFDQMPLKPLSSFTVEMIFYPSSKGPFEQRILHIGEVHGDRMLLEIRSTKNNWYFDGFAASGDHKLALINENLLHPLDQWHHVALIVGPDKLITYVNGIKELSEPYIFNPIESGRTSIGMRQNKVSWFYGAVYSVKISPKVLAPDDFTFSKN